MATIGVAQTLRFQSTPDLINRENQCALFAWS